MSIRKTTETAAYWTPRRIQGLRYALRESTTEFGERVGRSRRTVEDWEQGRRVPDVLVIKLFDLMKSRRKIDDEQLEAAS